MISPESFRRYLLDRMVLRPSRDAIDHGTQQRMTVSVGGNSIEYFSHLFGPEKGKRDLVVIKFPGTSGRAEKSSVFPGNLLSDAVAADLSGMVLTWNPPGYGRSSGRPSLAGMTVAARHFLAEVLDRHATDAMIWLCGNSLGCNVALHLAANDNSERIGGVILRNPPPLVPVVKRVALKFPMGRFIKPVAESLVCDMNAEKTAPRATAPAVFLKSMSDTLVPPKLQDRLIGLYGGPSQVVSMDGLEHDGIPTDEHERLISQSLAWLWQQNAKPNTTSATP